MQRTLISDISFNNLNKEINVKGWIRKIRKLGSLIFIDLIDRFDILQVVVQKDFVDFDKILHLPKETVVSFTGLLVNRKDPNDNIKTGKFELILKEYEIYNVPTKESPLIINEITDANEDIRLKYRYLDLRRTNMQRNLEFRSKLIFLMYEYLIKNGFINIETPNLTKITPEGANGFIIPFRKKPFHFYTLDQSPQIYKQLLMVAGMQKYFQVAKCFRDEDMRIDRQPEFTQLDIEMSFINQEDIINLIENMLHSTLSKMIDLPTNKFERLSYDEAIRDYGSDKPDLRIRNKIVDVSNYFINSEIKILRTQNNNTLQSCYFKDVSPTIKQIEELTKLAKDKGALGLVWLEFKDKQLVKNNVISKKVEDSIIKDIIKDFNIDNGLLLLINADYETAKKALGNVRFQALRIFKMINPEEFKFVWITEFPLFEYSNEEQKPVAAHHPFTSSLDKDIEDKFNRYINEMKLLDNKKNENEEEYIEKKLELFNNILKDIKSNAYDLVLNGFEVGGGSIRNHNKEIQYKLFEVLGMSEKEIDSKFGFLLDAFSYGVPPHGGIALGLDRLLMILKNSDSIRDIIAFPKNSIGMDLMLDAPNYQSDEQIKKYHIKLDEK